MFPYHGVERQISGHPVVSHLEVLERHGVGPLLWAWPLNQAMARLHKTIALPCSLLLIEQHLDVGASCGLISVWG